MSKEIMKRQEEVKDKVLAFIQTAEADGKLQFPKNDCVLYIFSYSISCYSSIIWCIFIPT